MYMCTTVQVPWVCRGDDMIIVALGSIPYITLVHTAQIRLGAESEVFLFVPILAVNGLTAHHPLPCTRVHGFNSN